MVFMGCLKKTLRFKFRPVFLRPFWRQTDSPDFVDGRVGALKCGDELAQKDILGDQRIPQEQRKEVVVPIRQQLAQTQRSE